MLSFKNFLGPEATKQQDKQEIIRQKKHLSDKAKENHGQSNDEGGGGASEAKARSYENAKKNIHGEEYVYEDGAMSAAPTNSVVGVAGTGDSRLPSNQREPGVSKKTNPTLGYFRRKPPKA